MNFKDNLKIHRHLFGKIFFFSIDVEILLTYANSDSLVRS